MKMGFLHRCYLSYYVAAALLVAGFASVGSVSAFTTTTLAQSRVLQSNNESKQFFIGSLTTPSVFHPTNTKTTSSLQMSGGSNPDVDTDGIGVGKYLLIIVMLLNVWAFSIPVEFRRARFCSEEDVRLYPDRHCTTFETWKTGITDYYANGGGVDFDFSVEEGNKWIGS